jgi:RimJ/RimL family protein N-acetyltransferase
VNARPRWSIEWQTPQGTLRACEPWWEEVGTHATRLAAFYNQPDNRRLLTNTVDMNAADVEAHFAALVETDGRPFLLDCDGALAGDADLRHVTDRDAEVAILIGARDQQGQGLGTRFGIMLHAFAFAVLGLEQVYAAIIPENAASLRMFEKLGHAIDDSARARAAADDPSDVTTSVERARFRERHGAAAAGLKFQQRSPGARR